MEDEPAKLLKQQVALARFGEFALTSDDLDEILSKACELVREALDTDFAKVMELQADGITLLVKAGVGWPEDVVGEATAKVERGSSEGHAMITGAPVISNDVTTEQRFAYPGFLRKAGVMALVNVIVIGPEGQPPYGLLEVNSREPRIFSESDAAFLQNDANLLAAAVGRLHMTEDM